MKATVETSMIGIMGVLIATIILFIWASREIFNFISQTFSKASAENVARQLSSLMTVSGTSYMSKITYVPTKQVSYSLQINSKLLKVSPYSKMLYGEKSSSTQPFATNFENYVIVDVNSFEITKKIVDGESKYEISAKKE